MNDYAYQNKKRDDFNLREYSALIADLGSASMTVVGAVMNNIYLTVIGGCLAFSSIFYTADVILIQREKKIKDITKLLESQSLFE